VTSTASVQRNRGRQAMRGSGGPLGLRRIFKLLPISGEASVMASPRHLSGLAANISRFELGKGK